MQGLEQYYTDQEALADTTTTPGEFGRFLWDLTRQSAGIFPGIPGGLAGLSDVGTALYDRHQGTGSTKDVLVNTAFLPLSVAGMAPAAKAARLGKQAKAADLMADQTQIGLKGSRLDKDMAVAKAQPGMMRALETGGRELAPMGMDASRGVLDALTGQLVDARKAKLMAQGFMEPGYEKMAQITAEAAAEAAATLQRWTAAGKNPLALLEMGTIARSAGPELYRGYQAGEGAIRAANEGIQHSADLARRAAGEAQRTAQIYGTVGTDQLVGSSALNTAGMIGRRGALEGLYSPYAE